MVDIGTPIESPTSVGLRRSFRKSGAPVDGTSGTLVGVADPGDILIDYTNKKLYVNSNTKASPTWSQILTADVAFAGDLTITGDVTLTGDLDIGPENVEVTLTDRPSGNIGVQSTIDAGVLYTGWALGIYGTVALSGGSVRGGGAGGYFELTLASDFTGSTSSILAGACVNVNVNCASEMPTAGLWIEAIAGTLADLSADGSNTDMPMIALVTSGAGEMASLAIEFGSEIAGKTVSSGTSGDMIYQQGIQIKVNGSLAYLPYSTVEGTFTFAYPIIQGATGASRLTQTYNGTKAMQSYTTCASTDGGTSYEPQRFDNVLTGAGQVGGRFRINMSTDVQLGSWANAFKAQVDLNDTGGTTGLLSVGCFELALPTGSGTGALACLELEMTCPATGYTGAANFPSYIFFNCTGVTVSGFQDYGVLFHLDVGNVAGTGNLVGTGYSTLRIAFGTAAAWTNMYIPLSSAEESFTTAYPILSTYSAGNALDITATLASALTSLHMTISSTGTFSSGGVKGIQVQQTMTSGAISGSAEFIAIAGEIQVKGNTSHAWAFSAYTGIATTPTIGDMAAFRCYCDNLGATSANVGVYNCVNLGIDSTNEASNGNFFISMYSHGAAPTAAFYFPSSVGIDNLIYFAQDVAPLSAYTSGTTVSKRIACLIGGSTVYLHLFTS